MFNFLEGINSNLIYIIAFIIAFVIACITTPISKKIAFKVGAIDMPKARGMHDKPMPLAGGMAIVMGFVITVLIIAPLISNLELTHLVALIGGGIVITIVGLLDDIYDLSAKKKLFFQILAALIVVSTGTTIHAFSWPWATSGMIMLGSFSNVITIIWIIGITNAVNLIDGLDGLAAGVSSIAALCLMFISILYGEPTAILLTAALAGSCLGFLPHNFSPATIFMGDTGSTFLGFTLSVISIQGFIKSYTAITIIVAILILGLPIFDTFFAILRRVINGKPVMQADRGHLHHRLMDRGYSHKRVVLTLYGVSGSFGIAGILIAMNDFELAVIIICLILIVWFVDFMFSKLKKNNK
ncbi:MAG: undecaprenyl/decaprenyl-phosphate alpha-N-acetylglucosaminyl 1-phosphate transferase [Vallitalea sp.]|jgi:UDP-GlcNAc:undecaprenyl-phosphate GlcNAc-1-phosphate transferase|nr:undecaprenyl/decaprenyl-phosphate alpha-N-acetylglucosaminyl 1-phosphate transferase [Vallitalea sp.]